MSKDFNQVEHFLNECEECENLVYKGCEIEHFLWLGPFEKLTIKTTASRAGNINIRIMVEVFFHTSDGKIKSLGNKSNFYEFRDFLKSFSYPPSGRHKTKMRRDNNNHIFRFIRRNLNEIIQKHDKNAKGKYRINSLNLTRQKELTFEPQLYVSIFD